MDADVYRSMLDLAWHLAMPVTLSIRGTHVNWTCVSVNGHTFDVDTDADRQRLIEWATAVRSRKANAPMPEPKESNA
jgi:hypothetical protein